MPSSSEGLQSSFLWHRSPTDVLAWVQAVTRQIMGIGQELTYAKERVALLDEAPKTNGAVAPQRVRAV